MTDNGVSRATRTSGLRSLRATSAQRVSTDDATPWAIRPRAPIEQGATIRGGGGVEPEANGIPKPPSAYRRTGRGEEAPRASHFRRASGPPGTLPSPTSAARIPHAVFVTSTCRSARRARSRERGRTPYTAPLAPDIPRSTFIDRPATPGRGR